MSGDRIAFSIEGAIARIVLNNPANRNAMDGVFIREFAAAALACEADPDLTAIVISARGDWFSAGGDLRSFMAHRDTIGAHVHELAGVLHTGVMALRRATAPVIAAVGGTAAGAGFSLVCGADIVVASEAARFVSAYTGMGLTPDGGGTHFLPRIVGRRVAFDLMATNPVLSAHEAKALGIVSRLVTPEALDEAVQTLVAQLADQPAGAVAGLKALLGRGQDDALASQLRAEMDSIARRVAEPATLERMERFLTRKSR